ncbi:MAG: P-loop NTPase [bacterium]|nr:P-loop NTPase [bacterium]
MKELVVCSGKGGTGKTSVVASLAALGGRVVVADCDVDAANLHLVLAPSVEHRENFVAGHLAGIRSNDCTGCGECLRVCQFGAVSAGPDGVCRIDPLACEGCGVCVHFCPSEAIDFPERDCGEWYVSESRHGPLVHARLDPGAENSGKLVTLVRREARRLGQEQDADLLLVDGPPGIGCAVIAALSGADGVLVVTEATKSGLHDMERMVALAHHFGLPAWVCLNKDDLDDRMRQRVVDFCADHDVPLLGTIPYDPQVTAAQLAGTSVVEFTDSPAAAAIRQVWSRVREQLQT